MGGRRLVNWVTALAALALAALMAGPQAGASYVDDSPSFVPPFIDAMDGIAKRGDSWPADPSTWTHTAKIAPRGSPIGETEARIKLRIEGKGDPINQGMPQQTILTYADSSSMASKDPNDLRCSAQKSYVDLLKTPSEAGVSRFADSGVLGHNLSANYASVKGALTCSSSGASNMSEGLRVANDELIPRKKPGYVWVLILLTDAAWTGTNPQPQIDRAQNESVRIYTICLVGPCNNSELQLWSQQTGGKFYLVNQPNDLAQAY
ncbi:MAG TPA: vWA domain-containing protein, partial [Thermoplasmata archaeon]|nr:vWA domain-containing protein [Thermoplasmata archaeon]